MSKRYTTNVAPSQCAEKRSQGSISAPCPFAVYHSTMRIATGTVISGKVVLDDVSLTEGTDVFVVTREREADVRLSPEELAELEAGLAEADRGETISGEELFARLRRYG